MDTPKLLHPHEISQPVETLVNNVRSACRAALMALLMGTSAVCAATTTNATTENLGRTLQQMHDLLDQQTKRLDRLCRVLEPHLEEMEEQTAALEKQQQEDKALALARIREM